MENYKPGDKVKITYRGATVHGGAVSRVVTVERVTTEALYTVDNEGFRHAYPWRELIEHRRVKKEKA